MLRQDGLKAFLPVEGHADLEAAVGELLGDKASGFPVIIDAEHVRPEIGHPINPSRACYRVSFRISGRPSRSQTAGAPGRGAGVKHALSIRRRLSLLFFAVFATVLVLGLAGAWSLSHSNEVSTDIRKRWLPNVRLLGDLNNFTSDYRTAEANSLLAAGAEDLASSLRDIQTLDQAVIRAQREYETIRHGPEETALYREFASTWALYKTLADEVTGFRGRGATPEAAALYRARSATTYQAASDLLGRLTEYNVRLAAAASERSAAAYEQAKWLMGAALAVAGLVLAAVIIQVQRQISLPLLELGRVMHQLAANDTGVDIGHTGRMDEIGEMARAVVVFRANAIELHAEPARPGAAGHDAGGKTRA